MSFSQLALRGGTLIDGSGRQPLRDAIVMIDNGVISAVGTGQQLSHTTALEVLDVTGRTILPGLIDAHVHLVFSAGEDPLSDIKRENDEQLFERARLNSQAALFAGVTLVRDCGGRGTVVQQLRDAIVTGQELGPRILASGMPITTPGGHLYFMGLEAKGQDGVRKAVRSQVRMGADFIKVMASGGNMTPESNPRHPQYDENELGALVDEAHKLGKPVAAHLHSAEAIRYAFAAGADTFEHSSWLGDTGGSSYDELLVTNMAKRGTVISPAVPCTFRSDPKDLTSDPSKQAFWREFQELRFRTTRLMHSAGLPIIFGTDAGAKRTRFEDYALACSIYSERFGLSPMEVIMAATSRAAGALGLANELGTVEKGKAADLVVVDGDPLADISILSHVKLVILRGRCVFGN